MLSASLPELTFARMVQKQWWVKLLVPWHKSSHCHETVGEVIVVITITHSQLRKENQFLKNVFVKQQQQFHYILTFSNILCDRMGRMKHESHMWLPEPNGVPRRSAGAAAGAQG